MLDDQQLRDNLTQQVKEAFGRVVYTMTCHLKQSKIDYFCGNLLSWGDIILTAITAGGLLTAIFMGENNQQTLEIISAVCAALALAINLYTKEAKLSERSRDHQEFAHLLWLPREQYLSLLTDSPRLSIEEIQQRRDNLTERVNSIYEKEPRTGSLAYKMTQRALKEKQEQYFSQDELNQMLPECLRSHD